MKKKYRFNCDVNGGIMVTCALRYALGRMSYVPGAVQDWIRIHWENLDINTKYNIIKDVFDHLRNEHESKEETLFGGYDLKEWEKFGIDRYLSLDYDSRKAVDHYFANSNIRKDWFDNIMVQKLCENHHEL